MSKLSDLQDALVPARHEDGCTVIQSDWRKTQERIATREAQLAAAPVPVAWATQDGMVIMARTKQRAPNEATLFNRPLYAHPDPRIAELEGLLQAALPYIKYPRHSPDAYVIAHDKMIERIRAALEKP